MIALTHKPSEIRGWHVLLGLGLFFGIVFAVDGLFMFKAIATFPGQTVDNPYEAGIEYNRTLAQREVEAQLGWKAEVSRNADSIGMVVTDRHGRPIQGLTVAGKLERPATELGRRMIELKEVRPGFYEFAASGMTGAWDFSATARDRAGHVFEAQRRLIWP
jgi:nitrogen fixation protein FixH